MVLAARTNWGLNDDGEARKANFRYHRISVFVGISEINKMQRIYRSTVRRTRRYLRSAFHGCTRVTRIRPSVRKCTKGYRISSACVIYLCQYAISRSPPLLLPLRSPNILDTVLVYIQVRALTTKRRSRSAAGVWKGKGTGKGKGKG